MASLFALGTCRHWRCGEPWATPCSHFGIWPAQECSGFEILLFNYDFYLQRETVSVSLLVFLLWNVGCLLVGLGRNVRLSLFLFLCSFCGMLVVSLLVWAATNSYPCTETSDRPLLLRLTDRG